MNIKLVGPQISVSKQIQNDGNAKENDNLKGIKVSKSESLEHLMFNSKLNSQISEDIYNVDCQAAAKKIIVDITPRQLTGTCGGG
ncbi:MAG: hypothetical protein ACXU9U_02410 [Parachlamydiaceae bacterium]